MWQIDGGSGVVVDVSEETGYCIYNMLRLLIVQGCLLYNIVTTEP